MVEQAISTSDRGPGSGHRLVWLALIVPVLLVLIVGLAVLALRWSPVAPAPPSSQPGAPLVITAQIWSLTSGATGPGAGPALAAAGVADPSTTSRFWLDPGPLGTLVTSLGSLGPGVAAIQSSPRVVVSSGQSATIMIGNSATDARGREVARDSREISYRPTLGEDGLVRLDAEVWMRSANGRVPIMLQDLGLPIGERRVRERIPAMNPDGAAAIWIPDAGKGWLVLIQAAPLP